jgi:hypothetical protein
LNANLKKYIFQIKFAYVANDCQNKYHIKNHIYRYSTPREMVICNSDGGVVIKRAKRKDR